MITPSKHTNVKSQFSNSARNKAHNQQHVFNNKSDRRSFDIVDQSISEERKYEDEYELVLNDDEVEVEDLKVQTQKLTPSLIKYDPSPSKSNKIPNSLAFKRRSNDSV